MPKTYAIWQEYYNQRLDWAYSAKNNFIASIDNNTFKKLYNSNSGKSVNIAVYGQPQVGKTTLILELMGIKKEYREYVSKVLRADIPQGESVTPTSIIYLKSSSNDFFYIEQDNECLVNEDELKQKLKNLRGRVENNIELNNLEELKSNVLIKIPRKFFKENTTLNINIIDLPGFGGANDKEQKHVKKVIENIIPILNLVLIVSRKITDLVKSDKPCRQFRYILAASVSNRSVQKKFEEGDIKDKKSYLEFIRSEFEELPDDAKVYPLDYGDSWDTLDKKIKNKTENIIDEIFEDLRKDISESSTKYNQLMQNTNHYKHIEQMIVQELGKFKIKIEAKGEILETLKSEKSNLEILNNHCIKKKEVLNQSKYLDANYNFTYNFSAYSGDITVPKLKYFLTAFINSICVQANEERENQKDKYPEIEWELTLGDFYNIGNKKSSLIRKRLIDYKVDWYSALTGNAKKDKKECEDVCQEIYIQIKDTFETSLREQVNVYNIEIDTKVKGNETKIKFYKTKIVETNKSIKTVNKELKELITKRKEFKENSEKNLNTAKNFKKIIRKGYIKEKNKRVEIINNLDTSKEVKFFNLLYLSLITSEFNKLYNQPV